MPSLAYGTGAYRRRQGDLPELVLKNMFVEAAKTSEGQVALLPRKGLANRSTVGSGPVTGVFSKPGCYSGDVFSVSAGTLYRETSSLGSIDGSGPTGMAGSETEVIVTRGMNAFSYNGTNLASIAFPDAAYVVDVAYIGSLFVFVRASSGRLYWSSLLDGRTIDGLSYFTAEREPDNLLAVRPLGDNLWLFGQSSIEAWAHTGDADLPFTRFEQVAFDKGIRATGCVAAVDNSLGFVGSDNKVYRISEAAPTRISDHGIEERIAASTNCSCFAHIDDGHEFLNIRLDTTTLSLDMATGEWCENTTHGETNWIAACAAMKGPIAVFGHGSSGQTLTLSGETDLAADIEHEFTAAQQLDAASSLYRVRLWCNSGSVVGTADPQVELFTSDDAGHTFESQGFESYGRQGEYRCIPEWRAMGMFDAPGVILKFRSTGNIRVSAVKVNEPSMGRSR